MSTVTSNDGTRIGYDRIGAGPAVILVNGALAYRDFWGHGPLAALLAGHFTVYTYDRRGRGESNDAAQESAEQEFRAPIALEREIEDLDALIDEAGGSTFLYGDSSGGALVLEAAIRLGDKVRKIAMYEAPYNDDETGRQSWREYTKQLGEQLATDRWGDAVALFMELTGATPDQIGEVRQTPMWPIFEAVGHTLAYDHIALLGEDASVPTGRAAGVAVPALVMDGGASYPFMHDTALALVNAIPNAQHRTLEGQTHEVSPEVLAPVLIEFFKA